MKLSGWGSDALTGSPVDGDVLFWNGAWAAAAWSIGTPRI